jgi:hypothetical protein
VENAPAPKTGRGLECDKLSKEGIEASFAGMMTKLVDDTRIKGSPVNAGLVATHIDSWENGAQNWTPKMREEFQKRRGYDLMPFLPVITGRVVDSAKVSERFLWDLRQTISDLVVENYAGHMRDLAHAAGLAACPTSRWENSGPRAARLKPAGAWLRPGTSMGSESSARNPSRPATRRNGESIPARSRRWAMWRFAKASTGLCFTVTRSSPGPKTAGPA